MTEAFRKPKFGLSAEQVARDSLSYLYTTTYGSKSREKLVDLEINARKAFKLIKFKLDIGTIKHFEAGATEWRTEVLAAMLTMNDFKDYFNQFDPDELKKLLFYRAALEEYTIKTEIAKLVMGEYTINYDDPHIRSLSWRLPFLRRIQQGLLGENPAPQLTELLK